MQLVQWGCQNTRIVSVIFLVVVCWRVEVINFCQNLIQRSIALGNPAEVGPYRRPKYLIPETPVKPVFSTPSHYRRNLHHFNLLSPPRFKIKNSEFLLLKSASEPLISTPSHYRRFLCFIALVDPYKRFLTFQFPGLKRPKHPIS